MRDREATERRIIQAVGQLIAREGFQSFGLRAVAREAGVDKRLVSKYFGSVADLIAVYARSGDFWWTVDELIGDDLPGPEEDTPAGWIGLALQRHFRAIRQRPVTQEILVWELSERNALTDELARIREVRAQELIARLAQKFGQGAPEYWNAVGALIGAATTYLVIRSRTFEWYSGVDLSQAEGWHQYEAAIDLIARAVFQELPNDAGSGTRPLAHQKRSSP